MAKDRARDNRRSVGSHEKMMGALRPLQNDEHFTVNRERDAYEEATHSPKVTGNSKELSGKSLPISPHSCARCGAGDHPTDECV